MGLFTGLFPVSIATAMSRRKCQIAWGISEVHKREQEPLSYVPLCKWMTADMEDGGCEQSSDTDFPLSWQTVAA